MILPTIISISIDALSAVPALYREGSIALGATQWQTVRRVVLPAASSGIMTAIILGMGRAVGETMAVIMVAGNALKLPALHPGPGAHPHQQHRPGAGLRRRPPPGGPVRHRHCVIRHHHDPEPLRHPGHPPEVNRPCVCRPALSKL